MTYSEIKNYQKYNEDRIGNGETQCYSNVPDIRDYNGGRDFFQGALCDRMKAFQENRADALQDDFRGLSTACLLPNFKYKRI